VFLRECRNPPGGIGTETAVAPKPRRSTAAARNARASRNRACSLSLVGFISEGVSAFICTCVFWGEKVYRTFRNLSRRSTQGQRTGSGAHPACHRAGHPCPAQGVWTFWSSQPRGLPDGSRRSPRGLWGGDLRETAQERSCTPAGVPDRLLLRVLETGVAPESTACGENCGRGAECRAVLSLRG
jgi:hypothetical protein